MLKLFKVFNTEIKCFETFRLLKKMKRGPLGEFFFSLKNIKLVVSVYFGLQIDAVMKKFTLAKNFRTKHKQNKKVRRH